MTFHWLELIRLKRNLRVISYLWQFRQTVKETAPLRFGGTCWRSRRVTESNGKLEYYICVKWLWYRCKGLELSFCDMTGETFWTKKVSQSFLSARCVHQHGIFISKSTKTFDKIKVYDKYSLYTKENIVFRKTSNCRKTLAFFDKYENGKTSEKSLEGSWLTKKNL